MARCARWLTAILATIVSTPVYAQEPLTLEQAVQAVLAQDPSIRAARAVETGAQAGVTEARAGFFPTFSISESWQRGDEPVFVFSSLLSARRFAAANFAIDSLNHPDPIGFFQTTFRVEQIVFDGGHARFAAAAARRDADAAAAVAEETASRETLAATQAFGRVLIAASARRAAEGDLESAREDLARAERRRDAGMASQADVLALRVHVADLESRSIEAQGDAASARADLNRLMGRAVDTSFEPVAPPDAAETPLPDLTTLLKDADAARPEIHRAQALDEAARATSRAARSVLLPQVAAQAAVNVSGTTFSDRASGWIAGGELRWTFSAGGAEIARRRAAASTASAAQAEADASRGAVHVEVVAAYEKLTSARTRRSTGRAAIEEARERQRIVRDRFEAGMAGVDEVLTASSALLDAEARDTAARVDEMIGRAMLHHAVGRAF